jgi:glyoxylase-like metal-dependent hydrolase (beta-lactamase superfamily II)
MDVITISYKSANSYLIKTQGGWLMIDAGWPDTFSQILRLLNHNNISVNEIDYLFITHFHPDHAGLTQNLKDLGTNLIIHELQIPYINKINQHFKKSPKENFKDITNNNLIVLTESTSRSFLESIGINGELVFTPGHSDDSVSLVIDDCCAFTGDLPAQDISESYDNPVITDCWDLLSTYNVKTIYPGHGEPYKININ